MLTLLIGTDWVSNTKAIYDRISEDVKKECAGRILIVPELISHAAERRLCAVAGNTSSRFAEVLSFKRLVNRVSEAAGHAAPLCMDNGGRIIAMASAVRQLTNKLKVYASVGTNPEFLEGLVEAVDEFKRSCISANDLRNAAQNCSGSFAQKLEELALLLECYDALCHSGKRDPRDQMTWLLEELENCTFAKEHIFYIDGFPDFTRQHTAILLHLIKESADVVVSLNCDCINSHSLAFEKSGSTALELYQAAQRMGVEVEVLYIEPRRDGLSYVREKLLSGSIDTKFRNNNVTATRSDSLYHECLYAAERILELAQNGVRYREISVVYSDPIYANTLQMVLDRCHIPSYFSGTESVLSKSVISTILAAMDAAFGGFEQSDVIRYLRSALSPLDLQLCDRIENYAKIWSVSGKMWLKEWDRHPDGLGADWTEKSYEALSDLEEARKLAVEPLQQLRDGFLCAQNMQQQTKALYQFLERINLDKRIDALAKRFDARGDNRNAQILNQLWDILIAALEQLFDVLGSTVWDVETFTRLFKLLLSQYNVGTIPTVLDSVTVGQVSAMRCQQPKHLIVVGVLEGKMPGYGGSTGVLSDQERTALRNMGIPLTGGAMEGIQAEFAEIYGTFTGAGESITVSYSGGQPSFIYRRLSEMSGGETIVNEPLGAVLADRMEAGSYLARYGAESIAAESGLNDEYTKADKSVSHKLGRVTQDGVVALYGKNLKLSASQVDKLADCRFHYFMRYGIRAKELLPATVDPAEFGTYVHAVLEETAKEVCKRGGFKIVNQEETLTIARDFSALYFQERFGQLEAERSHYLFNRNSVELELIVKELWDELSNCDFEPVGFEVQFGDDPNAELPSIDCSGRNLSARLEGFVDRVDVYHNDDLNYFRVVDYKTGRKDFDYCDVYNGLGLQMLLYMFALEQKGDSLIGTGSVPAGVQYFPARVPYIATDGMVTKEEADLLRNKIWKRKGLLLADEMVLDAMASNENQFRLPISRKKDGTISGDIATSKQFANLKRYIFDLLKKMVDDIASGNIEPNPYTRGSSHNACAFCPYGTICHQSMVEGRRNYRAMGSDRFWTEVDKEVTERG